MPILSTLLMKPNVKLKSPDTTEESILPPMKSLNQVTKSPDLPTPSNSSNPKLKARTNNLKSSMNKNKSSEMPEKATMLPSNPDKNKPQRSLKPLTSLPQNSVPSSQKPMLKSSLLNSTELVVKTPSLPSSPLPPPSPLRNSPPSKIRSLN
jgi:hypothetical protein